MRRNGKLLSKRVWMLLIPCILNSVAIQMGNVVDSMLVGSLLGDKALAAIQILIPVIVVTQLPGMVLGAGSIIVIGGLMGSQKLEEANKTITTIVVVNAIISLMLVGLILIFRVPLLNALTVGKSVEYWNYANSYLMWFLPSIPMINIALPIVLLFTVDNNAKLASAYMVLSNVVNLIFDYILIRYTSLGTGAAALSSFIGYISCMWIFIVYVKSKDRHLKPDFRPGSLKAALGRLGNVAKVSIPTFFIQFTTVVMNFGINMIILTNVGGEGIIAYTLCSNVIMITALITGGIGQIVPNLIGVLSGEKDYLGIRYVMKQVLKISFTFLVIWMTVIALFPSAFASLYGITSEPTLSLSTSALRIFVLSLPFYVWNDFVESYYQSTGKLVLAVTSVILENVVLLLPIAGILSLFFGVNGVVAAVGIAQALAAFSIFVIRKIKFKEYDGFLLLPKKCDFPFTEVTAGNDENQLMKISDTLTFFGDLHGISPQGCYYIGLIVEEMAINTLHFSENKKKKLTLDISVTLSDDEIIIRLRDDGMVLNPWENINTDESESGEPVTSPTRLVHAIALNTSYVRMLNMNNTIVSLKKSDYLAASET